MNPIKFCINFKKKIAPHCSSKNSFVRSMVPPASISSAAAVCPNPREPLFVLSLPCIARISLVSPQRLSLFLLSWRQLPPPFCLAFTVLSTCEVLSFLYTYSHTHPRTCGWRERELAGVALLQRYFICNSADDLNRALLRVTWGSMAKETTTRSSSTAAQHRFAQQQQPPVCPASHCSRSAYMYTSLDYAASANRCSLSLFCAAVVRYI